MEQQHAQHLLRVQPTTFEELGGQLGVVLRLNRGGQVVFHQRVMAQRAVAQLALHRAFVSALPGSRIGHRHAGLVGAQALQVRLVHQPLTAT